MSAVNNSEPATWEALGCLDQLHSLGLICVRWEALHNVLQLTTCSQLTWLRVHARHCPQVEREGEFEVINEVSVSRRLAGQDCITTCTVFCREWLCG